MVKKIEPKHFQQIRVCPLAGGPSHINSNYHVNTLVYELARKFHGESTFINATVVQESKELAKGIIHSKYFQDTLAYWNTLDIAVVGIGGNLSQTGSQWRDLLEENDRKIIAQEEAVGESCCRFFNAAGELIYPELQERIVAIPFQLLAKTPISLGVAYGKNKSQAILAMIKKGYLNSLVTDRDTLVQMLIEDGDLTYS